MTIHKPVIIHFNTGSIFGIYRGCKQISEKIVILCPAATGTRIGPQRIFVEIAQALLKNDISSLCVDLPPLGDSFDNKPDKYNGSYSGKLAKHYSKYINCIQNYIKENYKFKERYILSISDGCIPCYTFSITENHIDGLILLSPNHSLDNTEKFNKKNIKQYYLKLFHKETWLKLLTFKLNYQKIYKNIVQKTNKTPKSCTEVKQNFKNRIDKLLIIFGEKEPALDDCISFWQTETKNNKINNSVKIIEGADHSFFGWQFKRDVIEEVMLWLSEGKGV